jgi:hypothetical protein
MVDADGRTGKGPGNLIKAVKSSRHVNSGSTCLGPVMLGITSLVLLCVTCMRKCRLRLHKSWHCCASILYCGYFSAKINKDR